jgi:hypothetical protein
MVEDTALTLQNGALRPLRLCFLATDAGRSGAEFPRLAKTSGNNALASGSDDRGSIQRKEPPVQLQQEEAAAEETETKRKKVYLETTDDKPLHHTALCARDELMN